ncbi:MAG: hypothetical protein ACM35G_13375 [Planctomycetaceae bacterium]
MAANRIRGQGKLDFVRKILEQNRDANEKIVNRAWQEAGNEGKISRSAVGKVRALIRSSGPVFDLIRFVTRA